MFVYVLVAGGDYHSNEHRKRMLIGCVCLILKRDAIAVDCAVERGLCILYCLKIS